MCQTALISNNIVRLGTRAYRQRMEALASCAPTSRQLSLLISDLDTFYNLLYDQYSTITKSDYEIFGVQFTELLETLKELISTLHKIKGNSDIAIKIQKLEMSYSALYELNSDIVNFKLNPVDDELLAIMASASKAIDNLQL